MDTLTIDISRLLQQLSWWSVLDILLVASVFYLLLVILRGTRAINLLRGVIVLIVVVVILTGILRLRAISWLMRTTLPALFLAIPVIFQPEIRRALDRLGRASTWLLFRSRQEDVQAVIKSIKGACQSMAQLRQGGLIVIEREVGLQEYVDTGVTLDSIISTELLVQIFHRETPLHDGAVILRRNRLEAASCVLPLSSEVRLSERRLGLRHRAALGISEVSDAVAVVLSEETSEISVVYNGRIIRRLDATRLGNILAAFYEPRSTQALSWMQKLFPNSKSD